MKTSMVIEKSLTEEIEEVREALEEAEKNPGDEQKAQRALQKIRSLMNRFKITRSKMDDIERKLDEATEGNADLDDIAKLADATMTVISVVNRTYNQIKRIKAGKKAINQHPVTRRR